MIIWIASYPKSGNTWVRFFILSILFGNKNRIDLNHLKKIEQFPIKSQFENIGLHSKNLENLKEISKNWINAQKKINLSNKIQFYKTHNLLCQVEKNSFTDYKNTLGVIYIVRDPRNIITSLKNHYQKESYEDVKKFMFDETSVISSPKNLEIKDYPLPQIIGSWKTHYKLWKTMKKNYLLIKYENLINHPESEFKKISKFLEKNLKSKFNNEDLDRAISASSFDKLESLEKESGFLESITDNKTGKKKKFFYLGPKNNWNYLLDRKIVDDINIKFETEMKELGYL
tara:strand:- start:296 stop:1153 length:858 start_codon:yes stop_codon:yes gene_type:complete